LTEPIDQMDALIAKWKKAVERDAQLQIELRQKLGQEILAEFERMKELVKKIDSNLTNGKKQGIKPRFTDKSILFTNTQIQYFYREPEDPSKKTSSILVTQGKRGPIEYFGARERNGAMYWKNASETVVFKSEQLLELLI